MRYSHSIKVKGYTVEVWILKKEKMGRWYGEYFHEFPEHPMVIAALKEGK